MESRAGGRQVVPHGKERRPAIPHTSRRTVSLGQEFAHPARHRPRVFGHGVLDGSGLQPGDIAGLALLNISHAWIGIACTEHGCVMRYYNQATNQTIERPIASPRLSLRANGDFDADLATLSYSPDGKSFSQIGGEIRLPSQVKTFQGVRYALFAFNAAGPDGGYADFDTFRVVEPLADRSKDLPIGKVITLTKFANGTTVWVSPSGMLHWARPGSKEATGLAARFRVLDLGRGRVALEAMHGSGFVTVVGVGLSGDVRLCKQESAGSLFQWQDMLRGQCMFLSLRTDRYVGLDPSTREPYSADCPAQSLTARTARCSFGPRGESPGAHLGP
jgi:xylan 1,4-beta-xylosidase